MLRDCGLLTDEQIKEHDEALKNRGQNHGCIGSRPCRKCKHLISDSICLCVGYFICPVCGHENDERLTSVNSSIKITNLNNIVYTDENCVKVEVKLEPNYTYKAFITNVVDGDTIDAEIDLGFHIKIKHRLRLSRINTYEKNSSELDIKALALLGSDFTANKVLAKNVVISTTKSDAFGRYLAEVYFEEDGIQKNLNDLLLSENLAVLYKK